MKKGFLLALTLVLITALPYGALATSRPPNTNIWNPSILNGPLTTCTGDGANGTNTCQDLCDLVATIINIIYFIIGVVLWIITPVTFVIAGILYLTAGANGEAISRAKKAAMGAVIGLAIVLCSWLIVSTIVSFIGITNIGGFGTSSCTVLSG